MTTLMQLVTDENYEGAFILLRKSLPYTNCCIVILTEELEAHLNRIRRDNQHVQTSMMAKLFLTDFYHYTIPE